MHMRWVREFIEFTARGDFAHEVFWLNKISLSLRNYRKWAVGVGSVPMRSRSLYNANGWPILLYPACGERILHKSVIAEGFYGVPDVAPL